METDPMFLYENSGRYCLKPVNLICFDIHTQFDIHMWTKVDHTLNEDDVYTYTLITNCSNLVCMFANTGPREPTMLAS